MPGSSLVFDVSANTNSAVAGFKRLASSLKPVQKDADAASKSLDKIGKAKITPKVDTAQIRKIDKALATAKTNLKRLQDDFAHKVTLGLDTTQVQREIRKVESQVKALNKTRLTLGGGGAAGVSKIKSAVAGLGAGIKGIGGGLSSVFSAIPFGGIAIAIGGVAAALGLGAVKSLELADNMERTTLQMNSFIRNTDKTKQLLADVQAFSDTTPFEFPELAQASKILLGLGLSTNQVIPQLKKIGDVASQSGASIDSLTVIYQQMIAAGRLNAGDMNQLVNAGIAAWPVLAKTMGKTQAQVRKLSEQGKIGAKDIQKFWDALAKGAKGSTAEIGKTFGGLLSTLKDTIAGVGRDVGAALLPFGKAILPVITGLVTALGGKIESNLPAVIDGISAGLQGLLGLPGAVLKGLASVAQGFFSMVSAIEASISGLMQSIGASLLHIPGMQAFGAQLLLSATQLKVASAGMDEAGKATFATLILQAGKVNGAMAPVIAAIKRAQVQAQAGIQLKLKLDPVNKSIADTKSQIKRIQANIKNPKLKLDRDYWKGQLKKAQDDLAALERKRTVIKLDAKADTAKSKITKLTGQLSRLAGKPATAQVRADTAGAQKKLKAAEHQLAVINVKKANPKLKADSAEFKRKVAEVERKLRAVDKKKSQPKIKVTSNASHVADQTTRALDNIKDENVYIDVKVRGGTGRGGSSSQQAHSGDPGANGPGLQAQTVMLTTPPPIVQVHVRDAALADFIQVQVAGRAQTALRRTRTRQAVIL